MDINNNIIILLHPRPILIINIQVQDIEDMEDSEVHLHLEMEGFLTFLLMDHLRSQQRLHSNQDSNEISILMYLFQYYLIMKMKYRLINPNLLKIISF